MTVPLTPEREAEIRARLAEVETWWPEINPLDEAAIDLLAEIDRLRAELAAAEARGREAGLREAVVACDRIIASEPLSAYANSAKCCRAAILSLIGTPPPLQGGSDGQ